MGGRHVAAWQAIGHDVVAVSDVDRARAESLAAAHQVATVETDYARAIAGADVVSICLPLALHAEVTIAAATAGKHVFTEKPLAPTVSDAIRMEKAVADAGVHFGLGFQRNLAGGVELLRQWAAAGRFGRPMLFSSDLLQEVRPKVAMHNRNGNNGPFTDAGCHYYLAWQTVFRSRPKTVYAQGRIAAIGRPEIAHFAQLAIDTGVVTVEYESGDIGTLTASWGLAKGTAIKSRPERVVGPNGVAEGDPERELVLYSGDTVERVAIERRDLHEIELRAFAESIEKDVPYQYGFAVGRQIMAVTDAIFESIATGRAVAVVYP
jgi:myo-inositol 2-dehydrogenase/D-chiro-inositol 1-dehydrogenase